MGMGWNVCGNGVKTWLYNNIHDMLIHRKPSLIGSFWLYPTCIQFPQSNAHRVGVASTNRTDKFWHTGSTEYSSEEFNGWGVRAYARVWRSYLQAVLNECYFWFHQCDDVIIYVIPHYLYSDFIVVWMWYSTRIWGNMIYNGLITLRHCGFPFTEIRVVSLGAWLISCTE